MAKRRKPKEYNWVVYKNRVDKDGGTVGRLTLGNVTAPNEGLAIQRAFVKFGIDRFDDRARVRADKKGD